MKFVALPDGRRVDLEGSSYALENNQTLVVNTNGCCSDPKMYRFTAVTPGDAYVLIQAIDNFVSGSANISSVPVSSGGLQQTVEFYSATPNTWSATLPPGSVFVTGNFPSPFLDGAATPFYYINANNSFGPYTPYVKSDQHNAIISGGLISALGLYTIYYDNASYSGNPPPDLISTNLTVFVIP